MGNSGGGTLVSIVVIGSLLYFGHDFLSKVNQAVDSDSNSATTSHHSHIDYQGKQVNGIVVDEVFYSVTDVRITDSIGIDNEFSHSTKPSESGRFVIFRLLVENQSNKTKEALTASEATLTDSNDRHYKTSSDGTTALQMAGGDAESVFTEIHPNLTKHITLVFDVPESDRSFRFSPSDDQSDNSSIKVQVS